MSTLLLLFIFITKICSACEKFSFDHVQKTCPYTNDQLMILIDSLPMYDENDPCLKVERCAQNWLFRANEVIAKVSERKAVLQFHFETNMTAENNKILLEFTPISTRLSNILFFTGKEFYKNSENWHSDIRRMLLLTREADVKDPDVVEIVNIMREIYAKSMIIKDNRTYYIEPQLANIMAYSRDYNKLLWSWQSWFDNTGYKMRNLFTKNVDLENEYASKYSSENLSENWIAEFEIDGFEKLYNDLYAEIKPFYEQLHAYVRRKLRGYYGADKLKTKYIPAHLLGNMWAQVWTNIYDLVVPYKNTKLFNITANLQANNYTVVKIFKEAEKFFTSIGLYPMTDTFWKYSMFSKPNETEMNFTSCDGSATDFNNGYDYRIKMCTVIDEAHFFEAHNLMGRIEYFMSYSEQPAIFRNAANTAFQEAIGETISLSVINPTHLKKIGLLKNFQPTNEIEINFLLKLALKKIPFLPFTYLVDKWRYNVFRGIITPENYNQKWWEMVKTYQGIEPPLFRNNESFFDPGALFRVATFTPYATNYIAEFLQFQLYKSLCRLSGHTDQLYLCDFYQSRKAGWKLKEMLSLGASKHWSITLKGLTGSDKINSSAILEYFKPLIQWLITENNKYPNDRVGW
jgi:peptidyl-dipeptidase A